jgi:hypothetical protein
MLLVHTIAKNTFFKKYLIPLFLFVLTLFLYSHNLSQSVYGGDVGDFVTAASVMGVPHSSGYPLIVLLGFLLTRIHLFTPAFMVGLISVFSASIAVTLFYLFSLSLIKNKFIALISALVLAFNYLFWFYAEIAEVFALNNLFVVAIMFLAYLYYQKKNIKYLYVLGLVTGLSLTNNYIIAFLFPSALMLILVNYKQILLKPMVLVKGLLCFALGLLIIFYIPFASLHNPPLDWANIKNLRSFLDFIFRKDYGYLGVGTTPDLNLAQRILILKNYFSSLIFQLTIPTMVIVFTGAIALFKKNKLLLASFILAFFLSGPFFISILGLGFTRNFDVGIYERFFSMSSVVILFFFPPGLKLITDFLSSLFKKNTFRNLFIAVFLIIPLLLFKHNFEKTNLHNIWIGDNIGYDYLASLPKNSYLFMLSDISIFNTWYVKYVLNFRSDVTLLNSVGTPNLEKITGAYKKQFPKDAKNPDLIIKVLTNLSKMSPVFTTNPLQPQKGQKLIWMPYGIVFKLVISEKDIPDEKSFLKLENDIWDKFKNSNFERNTLSLGSLTIAEIPRFYSNAIVAEAGFLIKHYNDQKLAQLLYQKAILIDEHNPDAYVGLASYQSLKQQCGLAEKNLKLAMGIDPFNSYSHLLLYANYKYCFKDSKKANQVAKEYKQIFRKDLVNEFEKGLNFTQ